ncbi:MAG: hypothetical protein AB8H79_16665 [Myxococcota bacterium]
MNLRTLLWLAPLALGACWGSMPANWGPNADPLWDPATVVAMGDAIYVKLNAGGQLARISRDGAEILDLGAGSVDRFQASPDGETLVAFVRYTSCEPPDPRDARGVRTVEDCDPRFRKLRTEVATITGTTVERQIPVKSHYNAATFSDDGRWAVTWLDASQGIDLTGSGVVDFNSVLVLDLGQEGEDAATSVSAGFSAENVLFTKDGTRAIVLSKDSVTVLNLEGAEPTRGTTFRLTLDADQSVVPVGIELTEDGRFALITARGQDDLYALRLDNPSLNLITLSGPPAAQGIVSDPTPEDDEVDDLSIITFRDSASVNVVDHSDFGISVFDLDEPMNRILVEGREAVLWSDEALKDVYTFNADTNEVVEYRLENPAVQMQIAPGGDFAVALTRPEGGFGAGTEGLYDANPGLEVLEIGAGRGRGGAKLLEGQGVGMAFSPSDTRLDLLVLQLGQTYVYQLDLLTNRESRVELTAAPIRIGALPDGGFWITHDASMGLVSFYDPVDGTVVETGGFAAAGWLEGTPIADPQEAP